MTFVTVKQAEKLTGKSRQTLWRDSKKGKVSVQKDDDGNNVYNVAELERVYGDLQQQVCNTDVTVLPDETSQDNSLLQQEISFLREKIESLETTLSESKNREDLALEREKDLSAKLDKAQSTIDKQTYLLADQREKSPEKPVERPKRFLGIFPRSAA